MNYSVRTTQKFEIELKRLSKKHISLPKEVLKLILFLESNPTHGTPLGLGCYKIRLAIKSKGKGKSGGARVITCVHVTNKSVQLLSIYDKSEQESIKMTKLRELASKLDQG